MTRYIYSVIRFVPDPASGEFVNIGAIAGSDETADWDIRIVSNPKRVSAIDDEGVIEAAMAHVTGIARRIERYRSAIENEEQATEQVNERWLEKLYSHSQRIVQFSELAPMRASSAAEALEQIFEHQVPDPARRKHPFRTRLGAYSALLAAYRGEGLGRSETLRQHAKVSGPTHSTRFDFAVANGKAVQLAHAWSFETPRVEQLLEDVKAWAWTVQDLRKYGGTVANDDDSSLKVQSDIDIEVLYLPPLNSRGDAALAEAMSVFDKLSVSARPDAEAKAIATRARTLLPS